MSLTPSRAFWSRQRVFLTGHTGFKGSWTLLWLKSLGAEVCGYALAPSTQPSMFDALDLTHTCQSVIGDIRDLAAMKAAFDAFAPTVVIHMAAQPLVRLSYDQPVETYTTNVIGTVNVLELARASRDVGSTVIVTTDKCYENQEQIWPYREIDRLGGKDPYSNSKACAELVVSSYWSSYFSKLEGQGLASVRAGNVIGGGDWSKDRLVPDLIQGFAKGDTAILRNPDGVRPWQHVLEPVCGYLLAAEKIHGQPAPVLSSWNFGPDQDGNVEVGKVTEILAKAWGEGAKFEVRRDPNAPHEATLLTLDSTKAARELKWRPRWSLPTALENTADWYRGFYDGKDLRALTNSQIDQYVAA